MRTLLSNETVEFLMTSNNISVSMNESYDNKIDKLKSAGLLMKNHDFYGIESNNSKSTGCGCGVNTSASVIKGGVPGGNDINQGSVHREDLFGIGQVSDIKNYFKDGIYTLFGVGIPSCTFPNGPTYEGDVKIYSTYQCNDVNQHFLQKNILSEPLAAIDDRRVSIFTFNINNSAIAVNNLGSSHGGTYTITENKNNEKIILTAFYDEGYDNSLGRNVPIKIVFQLTPAGFTALHYYFDKGFTQYQIQSIRIYTYKSA